MTAAAPTRGRVVFFIRVRPGAEAEFLAAYETIRHDVANGVPGHLVDQLCRSSDDPDQWMITSEWEHLDDFTSWERSDAHRAMVKPLRDTIAEARSLEFVIHAETRAEARSARATTPHRPPLVAGVPS